MATFQIVVDDDDRATERLPWTANLFVGDDPEPRAVGFGSTPHAAILAMTHDPDAVKTGLFTAL